MCDLKKFQVIFYVFLLSSLTPVKATPAGEKSLITGGYRPKPSSLAKYIAFVAIASNICGGTIIGKSKVLTAAYCLTYYDGTGTMKPFGFAIVFYGTTNFYYEEAPFLKSREIILHPNYDNKTNFQNDIALIILNGEMEIDGIKTGIMPIAVNRPIVGTKCTAMGMGSVYHDGLLKYELLFVDLNVISSEDCKALRRGALLLDDKFCLLNSSDLSRSINSWYPGGPAICNRQLAGINSPGNDYGYVLSYETDVSYFRDWLGLKDNSIQNLGNRQALSLFAATFIIVNFLLVSML